MDMTGLTSVQKKSIDKFSALIVRKAAEKYNEATGSPIPPEMMKFLASFLSDVIGAIADEVTSGRVTSKQQLAADILKKVLQKTTVSSSRYYAQINQSKMLECGVALAALALSFQDFVAFQSAAEVLAATGVMAPEVAVIEILGCLYWAYTVLNTAATCVEAFWLTPEQVEAQFPPRYEVGANRSLYTNYSDNVCREGQPDPVDF